MKTAPAAAAPLPMALPTAATLASRALDLSAQEAAAEWQTGNKSKLSKMETTTTSVIGA